MKLILVLPGGGACGRWQMGVEKYLYDKCVLNRVDMVCGTSVGGLNALMTGKYLLDMQKAVDLWANIKSNKDIYNGMLQFNNFWDYVGMAGQTFKTNGGKSILDPVGLYELLDVEFGLLELKDLHIPIAITTTDVSSGLRVVFSTDKNPNYKCADLGECTSAIPLAFPMVENYVDGIKDLFCDGGLGRNNPVAVAIENGATHIILIGTSPDVFPRAQVQNNIMSLAMRIQDIVMHAFEEDAWTEKEHHEQLAALDPVKYPPIKFFDIYPQESTGSALDFSNVEQFQKGYDYAAKTLSVEVLNAFLK